MRLHDVREGILMASPRIIRAHRARIAWANTSRVPDDEVVAALRALAKELPGALDGYLVRVKHTRQFDRGWHRSGIYTDALPPGRWRGTISVMTPGPQVTGDEWLDTLAHEAKHAEQRTSGKMHSQKRERQSQRNAVAFASWFVEQHRNRCLWAGTWRERDCAAPACPVHGLVTA